MAIIAQRMSLIKHKVLVLSGKVSEQPPLPPLAVLSLTASPTPTALHRQCLHHLCPLTFTCKVHAQLRMCTPRDAKAPQAC